MAEAAHYAVGPSADDFERQVLVQRGLLHVSSMPGEADASEVPTSAELLVGRTGLEPVPDGL